MKSWFFLFTNVNKGNRTFEHLDHEQMIEHLINSCAESSIFERYLPPDLVANWLGKLPPEIAVLELGRSVLDRPIYAIEIGSGPEKILGWSQMPPPSLFARGKNCCRSTLSCWPTGEEVTSSTKSSS